MFVLLLPLHVPLASGEDERCRPDGIQEGGRTRRMPRLQTVSTGLPVRVGTSGEVACPVFVEGDTVDIRCDGVAAAAVRARSGSWYSPFGPDGLLVWVSEGAATAAQFPPALHWSELTARTAPARTDGSSTRCIVRALVGADGIPLAARARKECTSIPAAEAAAMTARFEPPCVEGGPWPVQTDLTVWVP